MWAPMGTVMNWNVITTAIFVTELRSSTCIAAPTAQQNNPNVAGFVAACIRLVVRLSRCKPTAAITAMETPTKKNNTEAISRAVFIAQFFQ
jgi:hypothetical protein